MSDSPLSVEEFLQDYYANLPDFITKDTKNFVLLYIPEYLEGYVRSKYSITLEELDNFFEEVKVYIEKIEKTEQIKDFGEEDKKNLRDYMQDRLVKQSKRENRKTGYFSGYRLLNMNIPKPKWLVEGLIEEGSITIFGGEPSSFKSFLSTFISVIGGSGGGKLFDSYEIKKIKVLILDEENRIYRLKNRIEQIVNGYNLKIDETFELKAGIDCGIKLDEQSSLGNNTYNGSMEKLRIELNEFKPNLVIIDSIVRFMVGDENSVKDVRKVFETLKELSIEYSCSFLVLHHTRKVKGKKGGLDIRGSGDFMAMADSVFMLNRPKEDIHEFELTSAKSRDGRFLEGIKFAVVDTDNLGIKLLCLGKSDKRENPKKADLAEQDILNWIKEEKIEQFQTKDVKDRFKEEYKDNTIYNALNKLIDKKKLEKGSLGSWKAIKEGV